MLAERKDSYEYGHERYTQQMINNVPQKQSSSPFMIKHVLDKTMRSRFQIMLVVIAVMGMVITERSGSIASEGYTLVATQQKAHKLEQENERLRIEIAKLKAPQRVKSIATEQLGMELPQKVYFAHEK